MSKSIENIGCIFLSLNLSSLIICCLVKKSVCSIAIKLMNNVPEKDIYEPKKDIQSFLSNP